MVSKTEFRQSFWSKLTDTRRITKKYGKLTVDELGSLGVAHARRYAPYFTGKTARSIVKRYKETSDGHKVDIVIEPKRLVNDGFDLVKWMHMTGGIHRKPNPYNKNPGHVGKHIKSGNPRFMYSTRDYLNKIKKRVAKGKFDRIKIK
jgi:hypothetical protein